MIVVTCQRLHRLCSQRLQCNDDVIMALLLGVQLGAMGKQLRVTGREEVAQPTHKH